MKRRDFLGLSVLGLTALSTKAIAMNFFGQRKEEQKSDFPFALTDAEWRNRLTDMEYYVLREHGTERAYTSELNEEKRNGTYFCKGCGHPLFSSAHKYDSRSGWPSFWQPIDDSAIGTSKDFKLLIPRIEVHCSNCGGHQGHVFEDGPQPTGLRYCINGVALRFEEDSI